MQQANYALYLLLDWHATSKVYIMPTAGIGSLMTDDAAMIGICPIISQGARDGLESSHAPQKLVNAELGHWAQKPCILESHM